MLSASPSKKKKKKIQPHQYHNFSRKMGKEELCMAGRRRTYIRDHDSSYILVCLFYDFSSYVFSACISQSQFRPTFNLTAGAARSKIENLQNPTFGSCAAASLLNSSG
jgi:hypothetical protein